MTCHIRSWYLKHSKVTITYEWLEPLAVCHERVVMRVAGRHVRGERRVPADRGDLRLILEGRDVRGGGGLLRLDEAPEARAAALHHGGGRERRGRAHGDAPRTQGVPPGRPPQSGATPEAGEPPLHHLMRHCGGRARGRGGRERRRRRRRRAAAASVRVVVEEPTPPPVVVVEQPALVVGEVAPFLCLFPVMTASRAAKPPPRAAAVVVAVVAVVLVLRDTVALLVDVRLALRRRARGGKRVLCEERRGGYS